MAWYLSSVSTRPRRTGRIRKSLPGTYQPYTIGLIPVEKEQPSPFVACAEAQHNRPLDRHSVLPTSVCRPVIMQVFVVAYKFLVSLSGSSSRLQVVVLADV